MICIYQSPSTRRHRGGPQAADCIMPLSFGFFREQTPPQARHLRQARCPAHRCLTDTEHDVMSPTSYFMILGTVDDQWPVEKGFGTRRALGLESPGGGRLHFSLYIHRSTASHRLARCEPDPKKIRHFGLSKQTPLTSACRRCYERSWPPT